MASWQMRRASFDPHLMNKAKAGELTLKDLLLIHVIEMMTKHTEDNTGRGCKSSNAYLADAIGAATKNYVSDRVAYLRKRGWLLVVELDGQRYIEMEWSRTHEERQELAGEYGDLLRLAYRRMEKQLKKASKAETTTAPHTEKTGGGGYTGKTVYPHTGKTGGGIPEKQDHKYKDKIEGKKEEHCPPAGDDACSPASLNGRFNLDHVIGNGNPPAEKLAARLFQVLLKHRKLFRHYETSPIKGWAKPFRQLLLVFPYDEIKQTLEAYDGYVGKDFIVKAYSADSFCTHYVRLKEGLQRQGALEAPMTEPDPNVW